MPVALPPIETNYLNPKNPDVRCDYKGYKLRHGIPPWQPLTDTQVQEYELDFLARLPEFQREREYLYPFFLNPNTNDEVGEMFRKWFGPRGVAISDANRDEMERQFAARKVGEINGLLEGVAAVPA